MAVMRNQSLGGFHWRIGARLNFLCAFAAAIRVILSVDSGQFAGGLGLIYFDLKLHQIFCPSLSIHPASANLNSILSGSEFVLRHEIDISGVHQVRESDTWYQLVRKTMSCCSFETGISTSWIDRIVQVFGACLFRVIFLQEGLDF